MPKTSRTIRRVRALSLARGIEKRFLPRKLYRIAGTKRSRAVLLAILAAYQEALQRTDAAHIALHAAVAAEKAAERRVAKLTRELQVAVRSLFGDDRVVLGDFGWRPPRKPGPKTVEAKFQGVVKRAARRRAG
jgi:hypothetical protein